MVRDGEYEAVSITHGSQRSAYLVAPGRAEVREVPAPIPGADGYLRHRPGRSIDASNGRRPENGPS